MTPLSPLFFLYISGYFLFSFAKIYSGGSYFRAAMGAEVTLTLPPPNPDPDPL